MTISVMVLDTGPLSLLCTRPGHPQGEVARTWLYPFLAAGIWVIAPEIADYEARRELVRIGNTASLARLDTFLNAIPDRFLPVTRDAWLKAAELWADARNRGVPTAPPHALDGDVILAAQALTLDVPVQEIVIATTNAQHLSRYLAAEDWQKITL